MYGAPNNILNAHHTHRPFNSSKRRYSDEQSGADPAYYDNWGLYKKLAHAQVGPQREGAVSVFHH